MEKSNLRNETFSYYYWKYAKYEMTKVTKRNVQFTKWTCSYQKISNLQNDQRQSNKGKCPIYEMDLWFSENIQFTKWPVNIQFTKWTKWTWESRQIWSRQFDSKRDATLWYWSLSHLLINPLMWSLLVEDCDFQKCHT